MTHWIPLFPLPNVVFFPRTRLPLHIFEPRYREMVADALAGDRRIVVVLLKPGWHEDYFGNPETYDLASVGRITEHELLEDGRYNIVLEGLKRVRIVDCDASKCYRRALIEPALEIEPPSDSVESIEVSERLTRLFRSLVSEKSSATDATPRGSLAKQVNEMIASLSLHSEAKQRLLELDDILARARTLEEVLKGQHAQWRALERFRWLAPTDPRVN